MVAFLPVVFSLVSAAEYECKDTSEGAQFQCEIELSSGDVILYVGRSKDHIYLGASTNDARWLSIGVGEKMEKMLTFVNHEDPKYIDQQNGNRNTHLDADDSYRGGSRLFDGHPKNVTKDNAKDEGLTPASEEERFKQAFFSFGGGGRKTHLQLRTPKFNEYGNFITLAWGDDDEDRIINYHGKRKIVLSLGSEDGSSADIVLAEPLSEEIDAKFESNSRIGNAQSLCVVSVSALLALLI